MAIKKFIMKRKTDSGYDVLHPQTEVSMVEGLRDALDDKVDESGWIEKGASEGDALIINEEGEVTYGQAGAPPEVYIGPTQPGSEDTECLWMDTSVTGLPNIVDSVVTQNSGNLITSGAVYNYGVAKSQDAADANKFLKINGQGIVEPGVAVGDVTVDGTSVVSNGVAVINGKADKTYVDNRDAANLQTAMTYTDTKAALKVNIAQGAGNVGKVMTVNAAGNLEPADLPPGGVTDVKADGISVVTSTVANIPTIYMQANEPSSHATYDV